MTDKATRLRRFLDGDIDPSEVKDDPLLASLASRIYGAEAEDFEELPLVDDVISTPGVDIGGALPSAPGDLPQGLPPPVGGSSSSVLSPATAARDRLTRSAARRRLQGTFPAYFGLLLLALTVCNFFGVFGGFIGDICEGDSDYCPPKQNKIAILSIGEIDTNQGWADELAPGIPDAAMVIVGIMVLFYGLSLRNSGRRLLEFKVVADIIAEDGRVTKEEAIELRDAASRLGISRSQHSSIAQELQSMADDGVDLLPGLDTSSAATTPSVQEPELPHAPAMIDLPLPSPPPSDDEVDAEPDGSGEDPVTSEDEIEASVPGSTSSVGHGEDEPGTTESESIPNDGTSEVEFTTNESNQEPIPPPIPPDGLPDGWTEEQWRHYGQQYLDSMDEESDGAEGESSDADE